MLFIAGAKTKIREVKGGRVAKGHCDNCKSVTTFCECDVADTVHAFFVELFDSAQRRMVCRVCGHDYNVEEFFKTVLAQPVSHTSASRKNSTLWDRVRRRGDPTEHKGHDIEKELAALKRELGKKKSP